jgi:tetratricopeptide (TPR) repeat protein
MVISCTTTEQKFATNPQDYNNYLTTEAPKTTSKYFELWNSKITSDSTQLLSFGNVANEYTRYFQNTGDIKFLKNAEKALTKAVEIAAINKSAYYRALARNYIAQHKFKDALKMAMSSRQLGSGLKESHSLLFDIHMELGNYKSANKYLDSIKNMSDFGYLIRAAKWNDHLGDLDTTISFMEKAMKKAESAKNKSLMIWTYSNIADYYGHAGRIEDSYKYYIKTLELDPGNAYVKKGIAWVVFSYEKNGKEALRILNEVNHHHITPEYYLLKAEIAQFMNDDYAVALNLDGYYKMVQNESYGQMYNAYNIEFFIEQIKTYRKALELAQQEVDNRATPETYSMLAYAHLKNGNNEKALKIVQEQVSGKTFEPAVLLRVSEIYKALEMADQVAILKEELAGAIYELGPLSKDRIEAL